MAVQPPAPPPISPRQMNVLRIVAALAWADGELAVEEVNVMLERFSSLFASSPDSKEPLKQDLQGYLMQNLPLEELVPKLQTEEERRLVLKLGYEAIASSSRTPDEPKINNEEASAYYKLLSLLDLPEETVKELEAQVERERQNSDDDQSLVDSLTESLDSFFKN